jgi:osmotically-inducible protein OsmY
MDREIRGDVERELFHCDGLKSAEIGVTVLDGVVRLTGTVERFEDKLAAIHAAQQVRSVAAVACELVVRSPDPLDRSDIDLARDAAHALALNTSVPQHRVRISVSNGWLRLEGTVDTKGQKDAAADAVSSSLAGARNMVNLIDVKPPAPPEN